ncbi:MAG: XRE family transcriptional regulator [Burkholderiaceae bacterium]|nr:XRE family transcriptional regulator [Burkholderiaceae bacterium]
MSKKTFDSVWDALENTAGEAANLRARADLMVAVRELVESKGWTQAEAARRCGVTQPRINDLLRGRISKFSLDALVNMAAAVGLRVALHVKAA